MVIGILSDIHDNLKNLEKALFIFQQKEIGELVFCGDFCSPIPVNILGRYPGKVHAVFGNNDGDRFTISNKARALEAQNLEIYGEYAEIAIGNTKSVAVTHYPFYGHALAQTGKYDLVCAGHTHKPQILEYGKSIFVNPGDVMGLYNAPTIALYNSETKNTTIIPI